MTHAPAISDALGAPSIDPANHCRPSTFDRPAHNVSGTAVSNRDPPIRHFFQKAEEPGNEREFSNARALANPSPGTLRRHALRVVRGDELDCPGKRDRLTALIGLQRPLSITFTETFKHRAAHPRACHLIIRPTGATRSKPRSPRSRSTAVLRRSAPTSTLLPSAAL